METTRHLLVDGYNVLHAWGWLGPEARPDIEAVRGRLSAALQAVADTEQVRVTVVFDGRSRAASREAASADGTVEVVYAPAGLTADGMIERLVAGAAEPARCVVATDDRLERDTVFAAGAECVTSVELLAWVGRCRRRPGPGRPPAPQSGFGNRIPL